MEPSLRDLLGWCITDAGQRLKKWIGVLDGLAEAQVIAPPPAHEKSALVITDTTLELTLAITAAYARAFHSLVEHAIACGLPSVQSELALVNSYKDVVSDPRAIFDRMVAQKTAELEAERHGLVH